MSGLFHNFTPTRPCERYVETSTDLKTALRAASRNVDKKRRKRSDITEIIKSATKCHLQDVNRC